jgi:transporter family protein
MEKWKIFAIISMLFAGLTSVIDRFGMKNLSSDVALSIRTMVVFSIVMVNAFFLIMLCLK